MRTGRHQARSRRRSLFFGAALAVGLGLAQMGTATAQEEPTPPDLQVTKTSSLGGSYDEGDPVTYTLTVTNVGETEAEDVVLRDDLPAGMSAPALGPTLKAVLCTPTSSVVVGQVHHAALRCGPVSLAAGESASVAFDADTGGLCGRIVNTAEVEASNEPAELTGDNSAQAVDQGPPCNPDIAVDVEASPAEGPAGAEIALTYTVTNTGESTLYGIVVSDEALGGVQQFDGFSLAAGKTDRFSQTVTLGSSPITSVATAAGEDVTGHRVTAQDSVTVAVVAAGGDTAGGDEGTGGGGTPFTGPGAGTAGIGALALLLSGLGGVLVALTRRRPKSFQ